MLWPPCGLTLSIEDAYHGREKETRKNDSGACMSLKEGWMAKTYLQRAGTTVAHQTLIATRLSRSARMSYMKFLYQMTL